MNLHHCRLSNFMNQNPTKEAAMYEIWKINYRIRNCSPVNPITNQINLVQSSRLISPENILMLSCHLQVVFPSGLVHSRFSYQNVAWNSYHSCACYRYYPSNFPWFNHRNNIWWRIQANLYIIQFYHAFLSFRSIYSPQHYEVFVVWSLIKHRRSFAIH